MTSADLILTQDIRNIMNNGTTDENPRPHYSDGTPAHTKFVNHVIRSYNLEKDFPICTYPVHPHGPTPYGRRCFSCMFLLRSSFLNSVVSLVCNYIIAPHLYNVNSFFTIFYIFIIHDLLTEKRLTFSIFREPYFLTEFLPIMM